MLTFKDDPAGLIPTGYDSGSFRVVEFKLIRLRMYVMIETYDDIEGVFQYPYNKVFRVCAHQGKIKR